MYDYWVNLEHSYLKGTHDHYLSYLGWVGSFVVKGNWGRRTFNVIRRSVNFVRSSYTTPYWSGRVGAVSSSISTHFILLSINGSYTEGAPFDNLNGKKSHHANYIIQVKTRIRIQSPTTDPFPQICLTFSWKSHAEHHQHFTHCFIV